MGRLDGQGITFNTARSVQEITGVSPCVTIFINTVGFTLENVEAEITRVVDEVSLTLTPPYTIFYIYLRLFVFFGQSDYVMKMKTQLQDGRTITCEMADNGTMGFVS